MRSARAILAFAIALSATPALAHTGHHVSLGFAEGLSHPFSGIDHLVAMVGIGVFAAVQRADEPYGSYRRASLQ